VNSVKHLVTGPHVADVDRISQQSPEGDAVERLALPDLAALRLPALGGPPPSVHLGHHGHHRTGLHEQPEHLPDLCGLFGIDDEPLVLDVVPKHRPATHPQTVPAVK